MPASNLESHRKPTLTTLHALHSYDHLRPTTVLVLLFPPTPQELTPPDFPLLGCWHVPRRFNPGPGTCVDLSLSQVGPSSWSTNRPLLVPWRYTSSPGLFLFLPSAFGSFYYNFTFREERLPSRHRRHQSTMSNLESRRSSRVLNFNPMPSLSERLSPSDLVRFYAMSRTASLGCYHWLSGWS